MNKATKHRIMTVVRIVVCVSLLWIVLRSVSLHDTVKMADGASRPIEALEAEGEQVHVTWADGTSATLPKSDFQVNPNGDIEVRTGLINALKSPRPEFLVYHLLIFAPVPLIQSARFQWLLKAQDIPITYWESVKLCYAGNFLNFTLVGSTGGDVFKAYYVAKSTPLKTEAVTTILLDRVIGLVGLLLMVGIVVLPFAASELPAEIVYFVLLSLAAVVVGALLFMAPPVRRFIQTTTVLDRLPLGSHLKRVEATTRRLLNHKPLLASSMAVTVLIHFLVTCSVVSFAIAEGMNVSRDTWSQYFAYIASGNIIAAIPITFMGFGTMEFFYKTYFTADHGSISQILLLAFSVRIIQLVHSLPGALITLTGAYKPRRDSIDSTPVDEVIESAPLP